MWFVREREEMSGNLQENDQLQDKAIDVRIILQCVIKKQVVMAWI
jgi:hypothetical protein